MTAFNLRLLTVTVLNVLVLQPELARAGISAGRPLELVGSVPCARPRPPVPGSGESSIVTSMAAADGPCRFEVAGTGIAPLRIEGEEAATLGFRLPGSVGILIVQAFIADVGEQRLWLRVWRNGGAYFGPGTSSRLVAGLASPGDPLAVEAAARFEIRVLDVRH